MPPPLMACSSGREAVAAGIKKGAGGWGREFGAGQGVELQPLQPLEASSPFSSPAPAAAAAAVPPAGRSRRAARPVAIACAGGAPSAPAWQPSQLQTWGRVLEQLPQPGLVVADSTHMGQENSRSAGASCQRTALSGYTPKPAAQDAQPPRGASRHCLTLPGHRRDAAQPHSDLLDIAQQLCECPGIRAACEDNSSPKRSPRGPRNPPPAAATHLGCPRSAQAAAGWRRGGSCR